MKFQDARNISKRVMTPSFCEVYDKLVSPHLYSELGLSLFGNPPKPHKKIESMFKQFVDRIRDPYVGNNFLEIGVGAGGVSFIASQVGFDVFSTDSNQTAFNRAWEKSRSFLNINAVNFKLSITNPMSSICSFKNGQGADYIYMDGVPFNKYSSDGSPYLDEKMDSWYSFEDLHYIFDDIYRCLNLGGWFLAFLMFGINESLIKKIEKEMRNDHPEFQAIQYHSYDALNTKAIDFSFRKV